MRIRICFISIQIVIFLLAKITFAQNIITDNNKNIKYLDKTLIVKVKEQYRGVCGINGINDQNIQKQINFLGSVTVSKKFPNHFPPREKQNKLKQNYADLSLIYELKYSNNIYLYKAINILKSSGYFEYVEPHEVFEIASAQVTPNDPLISNQYYISDTTRLMLYQAWAINSGDTNVVIGITDTGCDITHPDLSGNIKHNYLDPINGIDDDGDQYVDNFNGWDTGDNDNNPMDVGVHGTHVSGIAGASTNNNYGIAGTGFNCKLLPVKVANNTGALTAPYEGLVYAADHGANIINASWGSVSGYNQYGQDIITYVSINQNCLVVAAAGNNGTEEVFYPAAYEYVLAVSNVRNNDSIVANTSYGYFVDVAAPGGGIYSTFPNNSYNYSSGTSMASPCVAGCAGIVKSQFPNYTALQIGQKLKVTSDNIYGGNAPYLQDKLGQGRINLYRALTENNVPSFVSSHRKFVDNNDDYFEAGDTLRLRTLFTNYLANSSAGAYVLLSTGSPYASILGSGIYGLSNIATLDTVNNNNNPFRIKLSGSIPTNTKVTFKFTYVDGINIGFEIFEIILNPDYINILINNVHTTATSHGLIGYNNANQQIGLGFDYNGQGTLLYEGGIMIGTTPVNVSDNIRNGNGGADHDFINQNLIKKTTPSVVSDFDLETQFNDGGAGSNKLNISVKQKTFAWDNSGNRDYIINQYNIINTGTSSITNLYAGIFCDWDIESAAQNLANYDAGRKLGYVYATATNGLYAGVKLLNTNYTAICNTMDNVAGGAGGIDIAGGYDAAKKYTSLSVNRFTSGASGSGDDVCQVISSGPFSIASGDTLQIAFAILAGNSLQSLQLSADSAAAMYNTSFPLDSDKNKFESILRIYPNPAHDKLYVKATDQKIQTLQFFNGLGQLVFSENISGNKVIELSSFASGIYFIKIIKEDQIIFHQKIVKN